MFTFRDTEAFYLFHTWNIDLNSLWKKCYESKQYKKGLKAADTILKKFPNHGGNPWTYIHFYVIFTAIYLQDSIKCFWKFAMFYQNERNSLLIAFLHSFISMKMVFLLLDYFIQYNSNSSKWQHSTLKYILFLRNSCHERSYVELYGQKERSLWVCSIRSQEWSKVTCLYPIKHI
jgi:hypothetical protein